MGTDLTPDEELAIRRVECSSKWDSLANWLYLLIPCIIVGGIGTWQNSVLVMACAVLTFLLAVASGIPAQMREQGHLRSAVLKLRRNVSATPASDASAQPAPGSESVG